MRGRSVAGLAAGAALAAGCASGPAVQAAAPGVTPQATSSGLTLALGGSFTNGTFQPQTTCDQRPDSSPALGIRSRVAGAQQLALTMVDVTDGTVYWVQTGIAPTTTRTLEHQLPPGAREWRNDLRQRSYDGPCPPTGERHVFALTLYALPGPVDLSTSPDAKASVATLRASALQTATVTAVYTRTGVFPPRYAPGGPFLNGT